MHNMIAIPKGGKRENGTALVLYAIAFIIWGLGLIGGIIWGSGTGRLTGYLQYGEDGHNTFSWGIAIAIWGGAFFSGLFPYVFAEIICLLQKGNTISYSIERKNGYENKTDKSTISDKKDTRNNNTFFELDNDDQVLPFYLQRMELIPEEIGKTGAVLSVQWERFISIQGILVDIVLTTLYGDSYRIKDISFVNLSLRDNILLISDETILNVSENVLNSVKHISLIIKKYVVHNEVHVPGDDYSVEAIKSRNGDRGVKINEFLDEIERKSRVFEIKELLKNLSEYGDPIVTKELMDIVETEFYAEKTQGNNLINHRDRCIKRIMNLFGYDWMPAKEAEIQNKSQQNIPSLDRPTKNVSSPNGGYQTDSSEADTYYGQDQFFCINCGTKIDDPESVFCPICGAKIVR